MALLARLKHGGSHIWGTETLLATQEKTSLVVYNRRCETCLDHFGTLQRNEVDEYLCGLCCPIIASGISVAVLDC